MGKHSTIHFQLPKLGRLLPSRWPQGSGQMGALDLVKVRVRVRVRLIVLNLTLRFHFCNLK